MNPNNQMFMGFRSLKSLSLKSINSRWEAIEYFLYNCPQLERLAMEDSYRLHNIRMIGPSIMLRHLEIVDCHNIKTIEICDTNLVSFTYSIDSTLTGLASSIVIKNSPLLVEVSTGAGTLAFLQEMLSKFSCCVHDQLQTHEFTLRYHSLWVCFIRLYIYIYIYIYIYKSLFCMFGLCFKNYFMVLKNKENTYYSNFFCSKKI